MRILLQASRLGRFVGKLSEEPLVRFSRVNRSPRAIGPIDERIRASHLTQDQRRSQHQAMAQQSPGGVKS